MIPERYYPTIEKDIAWKFRVAKVSKAKRRQAGQTVRAQAMLRRVEQELANKQHKKRGEAS